MNARMEAIQSFEKKRRDFSEFCRIKPSVQFGKRVFHRNLIQELPKNAAQNWLDVLDGKAKLDPIFADIIAEKLKDWAVQNGATHFTHWFQALVHGSAEKHNSFLSWGEGGTAIERFRGKELLRGEFDASSFPSGGLRTAHEARGLTAWDPTVFPFLWEGGDGLTLCIPAVFFSWKGSPLDHRIPLLRSEEKLNAAVLRLLRICGTPAERAFSTIGLEQEYFVIDRSLFLLRPDLLLAGRTVFGAKPPKGQELEDHYLGSVKDRVLAYMREFEEAALYLGIPVKTRHNEVAPAQHEVAFLFERASLAVDHNVLLMELMRGIAQKHHLACLLHEKPFMGINGSGKHINWTISTNLGENLLDPKSNNLVFLTLLIAILRAIHEHACLLRGCVASAGNDHRLEASEAPPSILSVYLGDALEGLLERIQLGKNGEITLKSIDLGLMAIPRHEVDCSDRSRTSFFSFNGDKFEFRAAGASAQCSFPITVMNAIVADSLQLILDEWESVICDRTVSGEALFEGALPVLQRTLKASQKVIFSGNNYSLEWESEAEKRGLTNFRKSFHAFAQFTDKKSVRVLEGILTEEDLRSRYEICIEQYVKTLQVEMNLMVEIFQTQILPAAQKDMIQRGLSEPLIDQAIQTAAELKKLHSQIGDLGWEAKGRVVCELIVPKMAELRACVDQLEMVVDNTLWPLPKYRELLFLI
jgi:glutamine synthetase